MPNSNWDTPHGVERQIDPRVDRRRRNARRHETLTYGLVFPRHQKILLLAMTAALLLIAASNTRAGEADSLTVFRSVGPDGVVSFNDLGQGEAIALAPTREISAEEQDVQRLRHAQIVDLADRLADERRARSRHRLELALAQAQLDNSTAQRVNSANRGQSFFRGNRVGFFGARGVRRNTDFFDVDGVRRGGRFGNASSRQARGRPGNSAGARPSARARAFGSGG